MDMLSLGYLEDIQVEMLIRQYGTSVQERNLVGYMDLEVICMKLMIALIGADAMTKGKNINIREGSSEQSLE